MYPFTIVDAHCDTIGELYRPLELYRSEGHLDIVRMKQYQGYLQFFAIWVEPKMGNAAAAARCHEIIDNFEKQRLAHDGAIAKVTSAKQARKAFADGKVAGLLALEGGGPLGRELANIDAFYHRGVRCITLTWNDTNQLGTGAGETRPTYGLTEFGRSAVKRMNQLGILVDISHASDPTFWDTVECASAPVIATHSNSRRICNHPRNLTDEQFLQIKRMGGVTGLNLYPLFVTKTGSATTDDIFRHLEHFLALGGEDNVGLGADFDGIDHALSDLRGVEDIHLLPERMLRRNYPESLVRKIMSENFLRVLEKVCE